LTSPKEHRTQIESRRKNSGESSETDTESLELVIQESALEPRCYAVERIEQDRLVPHQAEVCGHQESKKTHQVGRYNEQTLEVTNVRNTTNNNKKEKVEFQPDC